MPTQAVESQRVIQFEHPDRIAVTFRVQRLSVIERIAPIMKRSDKLILERLITQRTQRTRTAF